MHSGVADAKVVVRTHGGLGNQLFQIFYARLCAGEEPITVIHDDNYPHAFSLSSAFQGYREPTLIQRWISACRVPKVLDRSHLSRGGRVKMGRTIFLDGYFQSAQFYGRFENGRLAEALEQLRAEFDIRPHETRGDELHHIRLGDFFRSENAQTAYLAERLRELPRGAFIITNREDLVGIATQSEQFANMGLKVVPSVHASPDATLRLMSGYQKIVSNDSTLAFWAACLAKRVLVTPSAMLNSTFRRLSGADGRGMSG